MASFVLGGYAQSFPTAITDPLAANVLTHLWRLRWRSSVMSGNFLELPCSLAVMLDLRVVQMSGLRSVWRGVYRGDSSHN